MDLKTWRTGEGFSQAKLAGLLGLAGENPASAIERIENGKIKADADFVDAVEALSKGAVRAHDFHQTRLDWLRANGKAREFAEPETTTPS